MSRPLLEFGGRSGEILCDLTPLEAREEYELRHAA